MKNSGKREKLKWWDEIQPSCDIEDNMQLKKGGKHTDFSLFEQKKREIALNILSQAATFLRLRSSACIDQVSGNNRMISTSNNIGGIRNFNSDFNSGTIALLAIDFEKVCTVFVKCATLSVTDANAQNAIQLFPIQNHQTQAQDESAICLLYVTETLIMVIHDMVMTGLIFLIFCNTYIYNNLIIFLLYL